MHSLIKKAMGINVFNKECKFCTNGLRIKTKYFCNKSSATNSAQAPPAFSPAMLSSGWCTPKTRRSQPICNWAWLEHRRRAQQLTNNAYQVIYSYTNNRWSKSTCFTLCDNPAKFITARSCRNITHYGIIRRFFCDYIIIHVHRRRCARTKFTLCNLNNVINRWMALRKLQTTVTPALIYIALISWNNRRKILTTFAKIPSR